MWARFRRLPARQSLSPLESTVPWFDCSSRWNVHLFDSSPFLMQNPPQVIERLPLRNQFCIALLTASVLIASAGDPHDTKAVQGNWSPVKAELGGAAMSDAVLKTISLKLGEGTYDVSVAGNPDKGTYQMDS